MDYDTNLVVYICEDCHYKQHFPKGEKVNWRETEIAKKQILKLTDEGHFGFKHDGKPIFLTTYEQKHLE